MPTGNGNEVWKWVAGVVAIALLSIVGYIHGQDMGVVNALAAQQQKTDDSLASMINWTKVDISRLNSIDAVKTQWEQMMEKKINLLLRHAGILEYRWPGIVSDSTGRR